MVVRPNLKPKLRTWNDEMATYSTNELKNGVKVLIDGDPCTIVDSDFVKPGKGQAFTRIKVKNLLTARVYERTYKSGESVEGADVMDVDAQYLYNDGQEWHFMDPSSYEQYAIRGDALGDVSMWLKEEQTVIATLWNDEPIAITPPNFVNLTVTQTDPGLRGDTATGATKPATLETGAVVRVPLFVEEGELLRIDTRTGDYVSRVKD